MGARILVCEDREVLRNLIRRALGERGYELAEASDGDDALRLARSVQPDLVLLDVVMPARSGLDVLEQLRAEPALSETPVILMTGSTGAIDDELAAHLGAVGLLPKPFSGVDLVSAVEHALAEQREK